MGKTALVCSGGGALGAFSLGAIKALIESGRRYDVVSGTSVGALHAGLLAIHPKEEQPKAVQELLDLWSKLNNKSVYKPQAWWLFKYVWGLWKGSLYTMQPLKNLIDQHWDQKALESSGVTLSVGVTSLNSGKYHAKSNLPNMNEWIYASAIFPAMFQAHDIDGELYVDGGLWNSIPFKDVVDNHPEVTEIDVVLTQPLSGYIGTQQNKSFKDFIQVGLRAASIMSDAVYNSNLDYYNYRCACSNVTVNIYQPKEILPYDGFQFNQVTIQKLIQEGYNLVKGPK